MTQATQPRIAATVQPGARRPSSLARARLGLCACALLLSTGCIGNPFNLLSGSKDKTTPEGESITLGAKGDKDAKTEAGSAAAQLETAKQLFARNEFAQAIPMFDRVASNTKSPPHLAEEARFFEAECYRLQGKYPDAVDNYKRQLQDFPSGAKQREATQWIFHIANYWLDDTRDQMEARQKDGNRWLTWPTIPVSFDKSKPLLDTEGRAMAALEAIYLNDPAGPQSEQALWYLASVKFFREDYRDADFFFSQLVKNHPNKKLAAKALEYSIMCKELIAGGPEHDNRKTAEARELLHKAEVAYPELAAKTDFLNRQLTNINLAQAAKDFSIAEFYQRTGHPASAYFYYEMVRRRYQGTRFAQEAKERMDRMHDRAEKASESKIQQLSGPPIGGAASAAILPPGGAPAGGGPASSAYVPGSPMPAAPASPADPRPLPPLLPAGMAPAGGRQ